MKIGILGGSFDPIHDGHLYMARQAYELFSLDEVWLIPAGHSPNKCEDKMTPANHRFRMCQLACQKYPYMRVSDIEIQSQETSYTYRTLKKIKAAHPEDTLYFIMGADSLDYFEQWVHPELIAQNADILVVNRDQYSQESLQNKIKSIQMLFPARISILQCDKFDISSTEIRGQLKVSKGKTNEANFLDASVKDYIASNHLYQ